MYSRKRVELNMLKWGVAVWLQCITDSRQCLGQWSLGVFWPFHSFLLQLSTPQSAPVLSPDFVPQFSATLVRCCAFHAAIALYYYYYYYCSLLVLLLVFLYSCTGFVSFTPYFPLNSTVRSVDHPHLTVSFLNYCQWTMLIDVTTYCGGSWP